MPSARYVETRYIGCADAIHSALRNVKVNFRRGRKFPIKSRFAKRNISYLYIVSAGYIALAKRAYRAPRTAQLLNNKIQNTE